MSKSLPILIYNHFSPTLSELDLEIASHIPPGGNWKNVPTKIPSKRLETIRKSFALGQGSRSTYYGRLLAGMPSYTINTYFSRPGNGCHLHYDFKQNRVLSHREAARLQSFPDNFVFIGSRSSIETQIGNAVPPILAYQIAKSIPFKGDYIDLFSGCGGLSLGFKWAGWNPIVANELTESFLETYKRNIHENVVLGDIREDKVFKEIIEKSRIARKKSKRPLLIIGGPPCQGFSTAGKKRSMEDERNWLFEDYKKVIDTLKPDGFVFENVSGLLNMEKGEVLKMIKKELSTTSKNISQWLLKSEQYGVPQRRTRLFLIGMKDTKISILPPTPITELSIDNKSKDSFYDIDLRIKQAISVEDALGDLPKLKAGEDGSHLNYKTVPKNSYQELMRGVIDIEEYIKSISIKRNKLVKV